MNIVIVTPAPKGSRKGNRVTALRWGGILADLGHRVTLSEEWESGRAGGREPHLLIALHARKSSQSIVRFRESNPACPVILCLTGTDVYQDITTCPDAMRSVQIADRIVILQPLAALELPPRQRAKCRTVYQSSIPPRNPPPPLKGVFEVCVLGHLRDVKDPFRAADASRLLPQSSGIRITQIGGALSSDMESQARAEMESNPRYKWLGEIPRWKSMRILSRCRLLVLTSILEGGANVISEALAAGVPVISSRIPGSVGLLGEDYPGYFPVGDTKGLAALLHLAETDSVFYEDLRRRGEQLKHIANPSREIAAWRAVIKEVTP